MALSVLQGTSGGGGGRQARAWHREWNVMKKHSADFCLATARSGMALGGKSPLLDTEIRAVTPRVRMAPSEERVADREYLSACRALKKIAEDDYSRFGEHHNVPGCFAQFARCIATLIRGIGEETNGSWAFIAPLMCPSPLPLLTELLTLDISRLPGAASAALASLQPPDDLDLDQLDFASPAATALAKWCHALQAYHLYLSATGGTPVVPGVSRSFRKLAGRGGSPSRAFAFSTPRGGSTCRSPSARRRSRSSGAVPRAPQRMHSVQRTPHVVEDSVGRHGAPRGSGGGGGEVQRGRSASRRVVPATTPPVHSRTMSPPADSFHSVRDWLVSIGLGSFTSVLMHNEIDVETVPLLTRDDLDQMLVPPPALNRMLESIATIHYSPRDNVLISRAPPPQQTVPVPGYHMRW